MFFILNDFNGFKNGMNKYNCDNRIKGLEEWKGFKNKFLLIFLVVSDFCFGKIDNKIFLSVNYLIFGI